MKTVQRLSDGNSLVKINLDTGLPNSLESIQTENGFSLSGATGYVTGENYYISSHYNYVINPSSANDIFLNFSIHNRLEEADIGQTFAFTCVVFCEKSISVEATIYDNDVYPAGGSSVPNGNTRTLQGGTWFAARSNAVTIESIDNNSYSVQLKIQNHGSNTIYISTPNLVNDNTWIANPVIQSMRGRIPDFYEAYDRRETDPQYPFYRFVDVLTDAIADTMFVYSDWSGVEKRELVPGTTQNDGYALNRLVSAAGVEDVNMNWLIQFAGSRLVKQVYDNTGNPVISDTDAFKRWQIGNAGYGRAAGTVQSIKEAVQFVLTGTKSVVVSSDPATDPWVIKITTLASETNSSQEVLAVAEKTRPLGYSFNHETVAEFTLTLGDPEFGVLGTAVL